MSFEGAQFGISECLYPFSKTMSGKFRILKKQEDKCKELKCTSLKIMQTLQFTVSSHLECDSEKAKSLDGDLKIRLIQALINNGQGRGVHHGLFKLTSGTDTYILGHLHGITNAGTHHSPLEHCESCSVQGHMEGQLKGIIYNNKDVRTMDRLFASYAFEFKTGVEFNMDRLKGSLEGVIISDCN